MALIESPIFEDGIIYRECLEDAIVIFSNQKLPKEISNDDISKFKWISRDKTVIQQDYLENLWNFRI